MTRKRGSIECGGHGLDVFVFTLERHIYFLELFELLRVSTMQNDVEAFGCKLLGDSRTNAITGTGYQSPGTVAITVALYGRGLSVEGDERNERGRRKRRRRGGGEW